MTLRLGGCLAALLILPLSGCAGAPSSTPSPAPRTSVIASPSPSSTPGRTPAPTPSGAAPSAKPSPDSSVDPSQFHDDLELEARIPSEIDGHPVEVQSIFVTSLLVVYPRDSDAFHQLDRFMSETGADPRTITFAYATVTLDDVAITFQGIRAPGASPSHLLAAAVYLARTSSLDPSAVVVETRQAGGKTVTAVTPTNGASAPTFVYARGELAFLVTADEAAAATILEALPL